MRKIYFLAMLFIPSIAFAQIPTNGLVAGYEFRQNLNDRLGGIDLLKITNGVFSYGVDRFRGNTRLNVNRQQFRGYSFTGTNNTMSISFWVGLTGITNGQRILQFFDPSGHGVRLVYNPILNSSQGGQLAVVINDSGTGGAGIGPIGISNNPWRHIVVTIEQINSSLSYKTYVDGQLYASHSGSFNSQNASFTNGDTPFVISPLGSYTGVLDDVYIYNRAITAQEVSSLYTAPSSIIYVDKDAVVNGDGSSWSAAYNNLESALANALPGASIWLAEGIYTPSGKIGFVVNQRDLKICGGFNGTETFLSQRDFRTNETILSGDILQDDTPQNTFGNYLNTSTRSENANQVVITSSAGHNLLLDGLTISDVQHTNTSLGGAIVKSRNVEKLTVKNCIVKNNVSTGAGAGIFAEFENTINFPNYLGELIVENCRFSNNWAAFATSVYAVSRNNNQNVDISNCLFDNNYAGQGSGTGGLTSSAMWLRNLDTNTQITAATTIIANVTNCTFAHNIDNGSGVTANNRSVVSISKRESANTARLNLRNSIFYSNSDGGASMIPRITKPISSSTGGVVPSQDIDLDNNIAEQSWGILPSTSTNNIVGNPLFTDAPNGDFTLQTGSPAIDTGDNTYVVGTTDLLTNQRIFNTTVDMGAYEFGSSPTLSTNDFNTNKLSFTIYPNPVQDNLYITVEGELTLVEVYSILGTKVLSSKQATVNVSALTSGVYFLRVETQKGAIATKRFIKQ